MSEFDYAVYCLSDGYIIKILNCLHKRDMNSKDIIRDSKISKSTVYRKLKLLRATNLVSVKRLKVTLTGNYVREYLYHSNIDKIMCSIKLENQDEFVTIYVGGVEVET